MTRKQEKIEVVDEIDEGLIAAEENLVIDVQFLIQGMLDEQNLTRADLARMTGVSKARLTQMMRSEANPTLRTLAKIFHALGDRLCVTREGKKRSQLVADVHTFDFYSWNFDEVIPSVEVAACKQLSGWVSEEIRHQSWSSFEPENENRCPDVELAAVA